MMGEGKGEGENIGVRFLVNDLPNTDIERPNPCTYLLPINVGDGHARPEPNQLFAVMGL